MSLKAAVWCVPSGSDTHPLDGLAPRFVTVGRDYMLGLPRGARVFVFISQRSRNNLQWYIFTNFPLFFASYQWADCDFPLPPPVFNIMCCSKLFSRVFLGKTVQASSSWQLPRVLGRFLFVETDQGFMLKNNLFRAQVSKEVGKNPWLLKTGQQRNKGKSIYLNSAQCSRHKVGVHSGSSPPQPGTHFGRWDLEQRILGLLPCHHALARLEQP